jgi:hypothetical protein
MRAFRRIATAVLVVTGTLGAGTALGAPDGYAANGTELQVSPDTGAADSHLTVTYRWPAARHGRHVVGCVPTTVTFTWDGTTLGRAAATTAGDSCTATLGAVPPDGAQTTGTHTIGVASDASVRVTFTVTDGASAEPGTDPSDGVPDPEVEPQTVGPDGITGSLRDPGALPTDGAGGHGGGTGVLIALGVLLVAAGMGTFGYVVWRLRQDDLDIEQDSRWNAGRLVRGAHRRPDRSTRP